MLIIIFTSHLSMLKCTLFKLNIWVICVCIRVCIYVCGGGVVYDSQNFSHASVCGELRDVIGQCHKDFKLYSL